MRRPTLVAILLSLLIVYPAFSDNIIGGSSVVWDFSPPPSCTAFTSGNFCGWSSLTFNYADHAIITDPDGSGRNVWEVIYNCPACTVGQDSNEYATYQSPDPGYTNITISFDFYVTTPVAGSIWYGARKLVYIRSQCAYCGSADWSNILSTYAATGGATGTEQMGPFRVDLQPVCVGNTTYQDGSNNINFGTWNHVIYEQYSGHNSVADGWFKLWLNKEPTTTPTLSATNVEMRCSDHGINHLDVGDQMEGYSPGTGTGYNETHLIRNFEWLNSTPY